MKKVVLEVRKVLMTAGVEENIWRYVRELVSALDVFGVEVVLATFGGNLNNRQRSNIRRWKNVEVYESHFKQDWEAFSLKDQDLAGQWLLNLEVMTLPDLIHLNGYVHAALPWNAPILLVGHHCPHTESGAGMKPRKKNHWERYRKAVIRGLLSANCVTAPTKAILSALKVQYGEFNAVVPIALERGQAAKKRSRKEAAEWLARQYLSFYARILGDFRGAIVPSGPVEGVDQVTSFA